MNDLLKERCKLFAENRDIMKSNFKWDSSLMYPLCASIYAERGLEINSDRIKSSKNIIKKKQVFFLTLRVSHLWHWQQCCP